MQFDRSWNILKCFSPSRSTEATRSTRFRTKRVHQSKTGPLIYCEIAPFDEPIM